MDDFPANLIIQNYYLSKEGYCIRVRIQSMSLKMKMSKTTDPLEILDNYYDKFDMAMLTVKGPGAGGTRFESEMVLDPMVAKELIRRGGKPIVKNRYSTWYDVDGWIVDVFGAKNHGLIVAECERTSPVVNLKIPAFCTCEVTDDSRFSNDSLVNIPYLKFKTEFLKEVAERELNVDDMFSSSFGLNVLG
jgi:CYTH domain-containing protein